MVTNIFITGEKGIGKSSLINEVIQSLNLSPVGFRTLPYFIEGKKKGFYIAGLVEIDEEENNKPISVQTGPCSCIPITYTFDTLGTQILSKSLNHQNKIILMDELGILEISSEDFVSKVEACLNSNKLVIGVLKKVNALFIKNIINRRDTIVLELTTDNRTVIHEQMILNIKRALKEVK